MKLVPFVLALVFLSRPAFARPAIDFNFWLGTYVCRECRAAMPGEGNLRGVPSFCWDYKILVYVKDGEVFSKVHIEGPQTLEIHNARVKQDPKIINLYYVSSDPGGVGAAVNWSKDEYLFDLRYLPVDAHQYRIRFESMKSKVNSANLREMPCDKERTK